MLISGTRYGIGKHAVRNSLPSAIKLSKTLYVLEAIYPACTAATKISILLLYRRIFGTRNACFNYALYIIFILLVGCAISSFFTTVFQCAPIDYIGDNARESCINLVSALVALGTVNTVLNGAVLILPMPMVWHLQLPLGQKIAICGIFLLGSGYVP